MSQHVIYHVLWDDDEDQWLVTQNGQVSPESAHDARPEAVRTGRAIAKEEDAKLVIHKPDGSVHRECTYGYRTRDLDPSRPID